MKKLTICILLAFLCLELSASSGTSVRFDVDRIWDKANHCAFPSIEFYQGKYYVAFREGEGHVFDKDGIAAGKIRVLSSTNGKKWKSVALLSKEGFDLRDPKLSVTPDGRLMLVIGGSVYQDKVLVQRIPQVSFSADGKVFSDPEPAEFSSDIPYGMEWLWRLTWHEGTGYAVIYGEKFALVKTVDGKHFETVTELDVDGTPNEATVRFTKDGKMAMMIRRETKDRKGWWGVSEAPYTEWNFVPTDLQLGGPEFLILDNSVIAGSRSYFIGKRQKTILLKGDLDGIFEEVLVLPSGGDCSYPGFRIVGDELWVVYYSSHELGHAAIYFAKVPLSVFAKTPLSEMH